ncbi:MAG: hypothetical protein OXG11_06795 [Chloroflexi bacterium]|nr:hypothetical protein [Chloroflexota bacterium]
MAENLREDSDLIADEGWKTTLGNRLAELEAIVESLDCLTASGTAIVHNRLRELAVELQEYVSDLSRNLQAEDMEGLMSYSQNQAQVNIGELARRADAALSADLAAVETARRKAQDARAGIVTVEGRGTSAERVTLPVGTYVLRVSWSGNSNRGTGTNFVIWLDGAGLRCNLLVNVIGASGSESHFCNVAGGGLRIQVEAAATASWSIRFVPD